jgi:hypothetical protein
VIYIRTIKERVGAISQNHYGSTMKVIVYNGCKDIWVKFEKGKAVHTSWKAFCDGFVKNPYDKSVYNVGYIGEGEYKTSINGSHTIQYDTWKRMMRRCYGDKYPTYIGCTVAKEWHNFQNFAAWYDNNYYEIEGERMELDKDILIKGNKIYSPNTCIFVPQRINSLFLKSKATRGKLPIGVTWSKRDKVYTVHVTTINGKETILCYSTPEKAFQIYKIHKEQYIKDIAKEYKDKIPFTLYEAMINYAVDIDD